MTDGDANNLTVVVVDDVYEMRDVLRLNLEALGGFKIVGEAADAAAGVKEVGRSQPDAVVLDLGLPDVSGADIMDELRAVAPNSKIVVLTGLGERQMRRVLELGADAAVAKSAGFVVETADAIRRVCSVAEA